MADSRLNIILGAKDEATKVVNGLRGQFERFKADAIAGFGLGAGMSVFNLAQRGLGALTDAVGDAIGAASDLAESQAKVDQVFTDSSGVINEWADDSARAFGLSEQAALEAAGTFGNFIQALGNTEAEANEMSRSLVELAADLASFNNTNIDEVILALRSGLAGEAEPMRRLGVSISATRVEANILAKGIAKTKAEITDAMKVAERYAIIFEDTSKAQGDFKRTADGAANQARILAAETENLSAKIGEELLPYQLAWNEALLGTLDLLGRLLEKATTGDDMDQLLFGEADAIKAYEKLAGELGITVEELAYRIEAAGFRVRGFKAGLAAATVIGADMLRLTREQIDELNRHASALALLKRRQDELDQARLAKDAERAELATRYQALAVARLAREYGRVKRIGASDALTERALEDADSLKELRQQANEARKSIRLLFEGPEENRQSTKALRQEDARLAKQRDKAFRERRVQALIDIDQRREEIAGLLETRRKQRSYFRLEMREWRQLKRGASETTDQQADDQQEVQGELDTTTDKIEEIRRLAELPVEFQVNVDSSEVDSTLAKLYQLRALGGGTAPWPGGWDGDVSTPYPRAMGGPVRAGETYVVGERGPELLHMGRGSGSITPNHALGSGHSHVIVMDGRVVGQLIDERLGRRAAYSARSGSYRS